MSEQRTYTVKRNRSSVHIAGLDEVTTGPATDRANTTGVVASYAVSACAALSRSGIRMAVFGSHTDLGEALDRAEVTAEINGIKMCQNCAKAARRALEV